MVSLSKSVKIEILSGSATGSSIFDETHNVITTEQGIINLNIGSINSVSFANIDWSDGSYFIKISVDGIAMGTSQLLSVPYALHANTAQNYNETDPLFSNHISKNITSTEIVNWNNAFEWGNHANAGYLTSFTEIDPIFNISLAKNINSNDTSNWNTTFRWGNHANAGYIKGYTEIDPIFNVSIAKNINNTDTLNWNTAYRWGSHVGLYRPINYVPSWNEISNKPFSFTNLANNQLIKFDGTNWVNFTPDYALSNHFHNLVSLTNNGFMSSNDKMKLDTLENANGSETKIIAGKNIKISGNGTLLNPYDISVNIDKFYLGQDTLGGIVFYIYKGKDGQQHGLIVSKTEGYGVYGTAINLGAKRYEDGVYNTNLMENTPGTIKAFAQSLGGGWYIPALDEILILFYNKMIVNKTLRLLGLPCIISEQSYWCSTEAFNASSAFQFITYSGDYGGATKSVQKYVRAIKAF